MPDVWVAMVSRVVTPAKEVME